MMAASITHTDKTGSYDVIKTAEAQSVWSARAAFFAAIAALLQALALAVQAS